MDFNKAPGKRNFYQRRHGVVQKESLDGRLFGIYMGRVTDIDDPLKHNRIKATFQFQFDVESAQMESDWLGEICLWAGPTNMERGRVFGFDKPLPEVGSLVGIFFNGGDIHDGWWFGQPRYGQDDTGAPRVEKDKHRDWSLRASLQNGFEFGVDTDGNTYMVVPGNLRVKVQVDTFLSSRGKFSIAALTSRYIALGVLRLLGVTIDKTPYPRSDEAQELREMTIDALKGPPGRKDPKIGKIKELD
jgi:hypothetical protein